MPYNILNPNDRFSFSENNAQLLVSGIANANNLKSYLEEKSKEIVHFDFGDHHFFEQHELENIKKNYPDFKNWVTTEKDGVRLAFHKNWFIENNISLYCLPIRTKIIGHNAADLAETVKGFLSYFYKDSIDQTAAVESPDEF